HGAGVETGAFDPAEDDDQATLAAAGRIPAAGAAGAEDHSGPGGDGAEERLEHCDNGGQYEPHWGVGAFLGVPREPAIDRVRGHVDQARSICSPVRVSTRTTSPITMNGGTRTLRPVSRMASFCWLVAVAPLTTGGVSLTASSTTLGSSPPTTLPSMRSSL